jgi:hypothetical protein
LRRGFERDSGLSASTAAPPETNPSIAVRRSKERNEEAEPLDNDESASAHRRNVAPTSYPLTGCPGIGTANAISENCAEFSEFHWVCTVTTPASVRQAPSVGTAAHRNTNMSPPLCFGCMYRPTLLHLAFAIAR